jgi:hypothetical protein
MVDNVEKCGSVTITYPSECFYSCICAGFGCSWMVKCNGTVFEGEGFIPPKPPKHPHVVTIAGELEACAEALQKAWNRRVSVPKQLRGQRIRKRTIRGTREEIVDALGLELGSRLKGSGATRKRQQVKIAI